MTKSKQRLVKRYGWAAALIALFMLLPFLRGYASRRADLILELARHAPSPQSAAAQYRAASLLRPDDAAIRLEWAEVYVQAERIDDAIKVLESSRDRAGVRRVVELLMQSGQYDEALARLEKTEHKDRPEFLKLKSETLMEKGEGIAACRPIEEALDANAGDDYVVLTAICYRAAGEDGRLSELPARVSSPEAAGTMKKLMLDKLAVAKELYARKLLNSSQRMLEALNDTGTEDELLLAKLYLANRPSPELERAKKELLEASATDPANLEAHQMLAETYAKLGDQASAERERGLVKRLLEGRP
jgi:predicted Zn-dependent protease